MEQKSLRANLEELRLKHTRLLLSYQGERLEQNLSEDLDSAQEAIERARAAKEKEEMRKRLMEEEERVKSEAERCEA